MVVSLPMRDGNYGFSPPVTLSAGVVSLPMRDGNLCGGINITQRKIVVSLPMRDGNCASSAWLISATSLLAYL